MAGFGNEMLITSDGKIKKKVLREGKGSKPSLHASCLVHYVGRLEEDNSVFMDTFKEEGPSRLTAGRGAHFIGFGADSVLQGAGLNLAVATMNVGEKAEVHIAPQYGYGSSGNFSFPSVPPDAHLVYDIELLGFDDVQEIPMQGRETTSMLYEERLEAAERRRIEGNDLFGQGQVYDALGKYTMAISYMDQDFMFQLQGAHETKAQDIRSRVLLNLAACQLRTSDMQGAVSSCTQVLSVDSGNAKALFRRGKARHALGQLEQAEDDLKLAKQSMPSDLGIAEELRVRLLQASQTN